MRIAVSGAHRTGKTTLVEELTRALPAYAAVDEPYYLLEEEGHAFAEMPSLEDFELQLERSIECIAESEKNTLFDRCPADLLAYLLTHDDADGFDVERWLERVRKEMQKLDLIVFVPVETPDRVIVSAVNERRLRRRVDEEIRDIILGDRWEFGVDTVEVAGPPHERVRKVLAHVH
jgi:predicted ATPase